MNAKSLIQPGHWPVRGSDTVADARTLLDDGPGHHLPVVDASGSLIGMVSEPQLEDAFDDVLIRTLSLGPPVSVDARSHLFDVADLMVRHQLEALPVIDESGQYLGVVRRFDLFEQLTLVVAAHKSGAVIVVEMDARDYTVARLVHAVEQSGVRLLSLTSEISELVGGMARITLKVNTTETARVRHMLEHYGYTVVGTFNEYMDEKDLHMRVQEFLRYLEV